jgi:hypothetical protein
MFESVFNEFGNSFRGYHILKGEKDIGSPLQPMRRKRSRCCLFAAFLAPIFLLATFAAILFYPHKFAADEILVHTLMKHLKSKYIGEAKFSARS